MNLEKLVNNISIFEIKIDRLDICIKEFIPAQLIQLIDAVNKKWCCCTKTEYGELIKKVHNTKTTDASNLI